MNKIAIGATELIKFFNTTGGGVLNSQIKSIDDFLEYHKLELQNPGRNGKGYETRLLTNLQVICQKLVSEGLLISGGNKANVPIFGESYFNLGYDSDFADYGSYDFLINGFLSIRNHFEKSVKPIIVKLNDDSLDIGTCFIINDNIIITAYHCIEEKKSVFIDNGQGASVEIEKIWRSKDKRKDLAIIEVKGNPFKDIPHIRIGNAEVLSKVLTMGYPPIAGFDSIQFAEQAEINAILKSSNGNVIGHDKSYLDGQDYILINARVKGGNSGGPVINNYGMLVGVLTHIPIDPFENDKLDSLGYGIALNGREVEILYTNARCNKDVEEVKFINEKNGFRTI